MKIILCLFIGLFGAFVTARTVRQASSQVKLCVPKKYLSECNKLHGISDNAQVKCVPARDRMECLEFVKKRQADVVAVDPEDMYVAYHLDNEDFDIISEIRTVEESHASFRYDGIILVKKGSNINSIKDLRGKKSCHTGFGRNVGYKIPLTKLRKHEALKLSNDPELSSTEKELEALSNFFEKSCIVGDYSPDKLVDQILKKRYSNLCALCENPSKCNYPDKYSGYDGAVRCLVEGQGDVAITKTYFVKKHFGLPISENDTPTTPTSDTSNYKYLCEDGSRKPITDPKPCSWAQRPWQGYMTNADVLPIKSDVQSKLKTAYETGKTALTKDEQNGLFIKPDWTVYNNEKVIYPGEHLFKAQYKDVIERDGTEQGVIRLCVTSELEKRKCKWLKRAAYSRDIRPQIECVEKGVNECERAVSSGKADVVILPENAIGGVEENNLVQILTETYSDVYVGVIDSSASTESIQSGGIQFDRNNPRSLSAALYFNSKRNIKVCPPSLVSSSSPIITVTSSKNLDSFKGQDKKLVCPDLSKKDLTDFATCNIDYSLPNGIYVSKSETRQVKDNIKHLFVSIAKTFGPAAKYNDVFNVFGEFEPGQKGIIFSSDTVDIVPESANIDKKVYKDLHCY